MLTETLKLNNQPTAHATFGGGCFWCTEAIFQQLNGVINVESGYAGGHIKKPCYREVCKGITGHAEVIHITYDPKLIDFKFLLEVFFKTHDPTTINQQGADIGEQYRSIIFYHNTQQQNIALDLIKQYNLNNTFKKPVVTQIEQFNSYYKAEEYHQNYYANNPNQAYCNIVINDKISKFVKQFKSKLKPEFQ